MDRIWIVVLEATAPAGEPALEPGALQRLLEAVADRAPAAVYDATRYALQLRLDSASPAEAMFSAIACWRDALRRLDLPFWSLARAEVLTEEEFSHDVDTFYGAGRALGVGPDQPKPAPARGDDELLRRAFTDSLTGLANRELFRDRVRTASSDKPAGSTLAVLVVAIDGFGAVKGEVGHAAADQVLAAVAGRLTRSAGGAEATSRLGGDTFGAVISAGSAEDAERMAAAVVASLREPVDLVGRRILVTASVGVAIASSGDPDDDVIGRAGAAMGVAKEAGGDCYRVFRPRDADSAWIDIDPDPAPDRMAYVVLLQRAALAANESATIEAAAASVLHQVCALAGWTAGHLWVTDADGRAMTASGVWNANVAESLAAVRSHLERADRLSGEGLAEQVLRTGRATWSDDLEGDCAIPRELAAAAGLHSAFAFPVVVGREVVAVLDLLSARPTAPDDSMVDVMASVCAQLGRVVERDRARTALAESERRYRQLIDAVPMLVWRSDAGGRCIYLNSRKLDFLGQTAEEAQAGWPDSIHPDDRAHFGQVCHGAFERREPFEVEYRLRRADGEYRWILLRAQPVGEGETFEGYVGGGIDVTDKHVAEEAARDREAHFRALVQNTNVMISVLGADGTLVEAYVGACDLGYEAGSGLGRLGMEFLHPDDVERAATAYAGVLSRPPGAGSPFECRARHADGSWRWVEVVANNLLDDPTVGGILVTVADITPRKEAEEAAQDWSAHLREAQALARTGSWCRDLITGATFWSDELYRILGRTSAEHPAGLAQLLAAVHPDDRERMAALAASLEGGDAGTNEYRVVRPSGEVRRVRSRSVVVRDDSGRPIRVFGTICDLDE
ncbi:MAG: PAS domain-containing protein [Actinomycetota bacterium]|nr:PAS domain-containing protein [Actinomycetota bacterium]